MRVLSFFLVIGICTIVGSTESLPCGSNFTGSLMMPSTMSMITPCNGQDPIILVPQSKLCGQVVSTGQSVFYALALENNNVQLTDLQVGITVYVLNATSLDPTEFPTVYIGKGSCPSTTCPAASDPFSIACGYDKIMQASDINSVSQPLQTYYRNTQDGIYYIQVLGPTQGTKNSVAISFDIQIDNGQMNLDRYVSVISVLLFSFVFGVGIAIIYAWKKSHGGWKKDEEAAPPKDVKDKDTFIQLNSMSSMNNLLKRTESNLSLGSESVSLDSVVTLFREQTAAINKLTEGAVRVENTRKSLEDTKKEKEEKKKSDDDVESSLKHKEGVVRRDSFVLKSDNSSNSDDSD